MTLTTGARYCFAALLVLTASVAQAQAQYPTGPTSGVPYVSFVPRPVDPQSRLTFDVVDGYIIQNFRDDLNSNQVADTELFNNQQVLNADPGVLTQKPNDPTPNFPSDLAAWGSLYNNVQGDPPSFVPPIRGFKLTFTSFASNIAFDSLQRTNDLQNFLIDEGNNRIPTWDIISFKEQNPDNVRWNWTVIFNQPLDDSYLWGFETFFGPNDHFLAVQILAGGFNATDPITFSATASPTRFVVPEPGVVALGTAFCLGVGFLGLKRRRS